MTMIPSHKPAGARRIRPLLAVVLLAALATSPVAHGAVLSEDPGDQTYLTIAINEALETRKTDVEIPLRNPDTGSHGTLVIERTYYRDPTTPCRDYRRAIERAGAPLSEVRGTGCRIGKALWSLDEVMVTPSQRGASSSGKRNGPVALSPSAPAPAAKPPAEGRAAKAGGARAPASPPPAADAPPPAPSVPAYTLPSRADL